MRTRNSIQTPWLWLLPVLALALLPVMDAHAQVTPTTTGALTSVTTGLATNDVVSVSSSAVPVPPGRATAIWPEFRMASSATGNVVFGIQVSRDGSAWSTVSGLTYTVAANGTNLVRGYWLLDPTELAAAHSWRLSSVNNAANAVVLTNLLVNWSYASGP